VGPAGVDAGAAGVVEPSAAELAGEADASEPGSPEAAAVASRVGG
jgi:hypothetical protein